MSTFALGIFIGIILGILLSLLVSAFVRMYNSQLRHERKISQTGGKKS